MLSSEYLHWEDVERVGKDWLPSSWAALAESKCSLQQD